MTSELSLLISELAVPDDVDVTLTPKQRNQIVSYIDWLEKQLDAYRKRKRLKP